MAGNQLTGTPEGDLYCTSAPKFQGLVNNSYLALCQLCAGEVKEPWKFLPSFVKNLKKSWCFASNRHKEETSRLYKLLCMVCPISGVGYEETLIAAEQGNNQMLLQKEPTALEWRFLEKTSTLRILVSSFHPLNPILVAGAATHSPRDLPLLLCPACPLILLLSPPVLPLNLTLIHRPLQCSCAYFMEEPGASCAGHVQAKKTAFLY